MSRLGYTNVVIRDRDTDQHLVTMRYVGDNQYVLTWADGPSGHRISGEQAHDLYTSYQRSPRFSRLSVQVI